jgi:CRP/FNR family transcriptional regulator, polysaccharide utilization system transcription regulator
VKKVLPPPVRLPRATSACVGAGSDGVCIFRGWAAEQGLSAVACERMAPLWRTNLYQRGDIIFYQGNAPSSVYFLCSGSVKLVRDARMGRQHILRMVNGPDFLGERALLAGQPYAASAQVMEDSRVCAIERERFRGLWRNEPELSRMLAIYLSRKLAESDEAACDLALLTIRELLSRLIMERLGTSGGDLVQFSESRQDLADILGTSAEVISRTLSELARKKLVALDGRSVRVLDKERLRVIGGMQAPRADFYQPPACVPSMRSPALRHKIVTGQMSRIISTNIRKTK